MVVVVVPKRAGSIRHKDIIVWSKVKKELDEAAKIQPCRACKHDMELLSSFLATKIKLLQGNGTETDEETIKKVKSLDYLNELSSVAIYLSKISRPFFGLKLFTVPSKYKTTLDRSRRANRAIRKHLCFAKLILSKLEVKDKEYLAVSKILKGSIRATVFKLNADPMTFMLFDRVIGFGYKTHLLRFTGNAITGAKNLISCCIDQ